MCGSGPKAFGRVLNSATFKEYSTFTRQYSQTGGYQRALNDYNSVLGTNIPQSQPGVYVKNIGGSFNLTLYRSSGGKPSLQLTPGLAEKKYDKIRYEN